MKTVEYRCKYCGQLLFTSKISFTCLDKEETHYGRKNYDLEVKCCCGRYNWWKKN